MVERTVLGGGEFQGEGGREGKKCGRLPRGGNAERKRDAADGAGCSFEHFRFSFFFFFLFTDIIWFTSFYDGPYLLPRNEKKISLYCALEPRSRGRKWREKLETASRRGFSAGFGINDDSYA